MRVCRACSRLLPDLEAAGIEDNKLHVDLSKMLKECVPELEYKVADSCLCYKCFSLLYLFQEFKKTCLETEGRIRSYMERHPQAGFVTLLDVVEDEEDEKGTLEVVETPVLVKVEESEKNDNEVDEIESHEQVEVKQEVVDLTDCEEGETQKKSGVNCAAYTRCGLCGHFVPLTEFLQHVNACASKSKTIDTGPSESPSKVKVLQKRLFSCQQCNYKNFSPGTVQKHIHYKHKRDFKCNKCTYSTFSESEFQKHNLAHSGG